MKLVNKNDDLLPYGYFTGYSFYVWFDLLNIAYEDPKCPASEIFLN